MIIASQNDSQVEAIKLCERITTFYDCLNDNRWQECFELVDPVLRHNGQIGFESYVKSLTRFFETYGPISNVAIGDVKLHMHDIRHPAHAILNAVSTECNASAKRDDRDFAYAVATWDDRTHAPHKSQERWVREDDGRWYSRKVGMV